MNVTLGRFHNVTGVAVNEDCISILDDRGLERMIRFMPYHRQPLFVRGEFGDFTKVGGGELIHGISPTDVTDVEIEVDYADSDFHTRQLRVRNRAGIDLTWELFCEGLPEA